MHGNWNRLRAVFGENNKTVVIADDFTDVVADIAVYKPKNLQSELPKNFLFGNFEKYLYYPAFCKGTDVEELEKRVSEGKIDGIYAENYAGVLFAERNNLKIFAGIGFNFINSLAIREFLRLPNARYYAISKETNIREGSALIGENAFVLASGGIKLMDLCYCPFGKTCTSCDKKDLYNLTDENGREFPVRRYLAGNGACRFEVYNCADLIGQGLKGAGRILDLTLIKNKKAACFAKTDEEQKKLYKNYTSGHFKRGVL